VLKHLGLFCGILLLGMGCASPFVSSVGAASRGAEAQRNLALALESATRNLNQFARLNGKHVLVRTEAISGSDVSETDAAFVDSFIRTKLVTVARAFLAEPGEEDTVLLVRVCSFGVDVTNRGYPFIFLPLFFMANYRAYVELDLFAFNKADMSPILSMKLAGDSAWSHMAILGVGPF